MKKALYLLLLSAVFANSAAAQLPLQPGKEVVIKKDITFKQLENRDIKLDIYLPETKSDSKKPLLVWVHGGAWKRGSKDAIPEKNPLLLKSVLDEGYALASVDYRLSGEASFPAAVVDINDAINYLAKHAQQYNIAADKIIIMGRSAGGHLASLIGATNPHDDIDLYSKPNYKVRAVVSFFGATDLLALGNKGKRKATAGSSVSRFLGGIPDTIPETAKKASPTNYISSDSPAFILLHGDLDKRVPLTQSTILQAVLDENGVENELWVENGVGHSAPIFDSEKYVPHVIRFIKKHLP